MSRLVINKDKIRLFFDNIQDKSGENWDQIGRKVRLSGRTIRDWRRGVLLPNKEKLEKLALIFQQRLPLVIEEREEYWTKKYARKGALARLKKYGPPGTPEGRRKGGLISQQKRRERPEYYRKLGVNIRKKIKIPKHSIFLAEFMGIVLGDGGLSLEQCFITLNCIKDKQYSIYVKKLIKKLFGVDASIYLRPINGTITVAVSGRDFIEFLVKEGLKVGNKVKNQVDVPEWVKNNFIFSKRCLRGLMDTDGGIFIHRYKIKRKEYRYKKICFTNKSQPLLNFVFNALRKLGLNPKRFNDNKIWLYSEVEVKKYFKLVNSSNQRLLKVI
ncbi:hypothetical protein A3I57_00780 [Candidatus Beckwithbacteria bacterium RIFCSPLOWO2_02_FULL_47_23]|uniref:DOD-type homing endonuclease domain-containing protein n=2 Tax=Candidatus Beckwithiibacteriota TaxID=1752726 RepID=A0A1F5DRY4_9BACT|nr:MAG: hypothetical protein A3E73_02720 [Candidatus Beckwithbacteria bacterium RIFCSPHIGHO2_12_FULL_47_17]OGD57810.1 MAG: hypothetical protein A3I57_00780 [Candidatus Beckwithbacteria bacterium RIFCSPLOWO2_02_FULL_47_23]